MTNIPEDIQENIQKNYEYTLNQLKIESIKNNINEKEKYIRKLTKNKDISESDKNFKILKLELEIYEEKCKLKSLNI